MYDRIGSKKNFLIIKVLIVFDNDQQYKRNLWT